MRHRRVSHGARTFTATSSQGLLYMAECLTYAAGGRFPIVMMNANRATALPWNIYGDQRDSLALWTTAGCRRTRRTTRRRLTWHSWPTP